MAQKNTDFLMQAWTTKKTQKNSKEHNLDVELLLEVALCVCYISTVPYSSNPLMTGICEKHSFQNAVSEMWSGQAIQYSSSNTIKSKEVSNSKYIILEENYQNNSFVKDLFQVRLFCL